MKTFKVIRNNRGLTLVEVLIALVILTLAAIGAASMQTNFGTLTAAREDYNCVYDVADKAMSECRAGVTPASPVTCANRSVTVAVTGTCPTAVGDCQDISINASYNSASILWSSYVCRF